MRHPYAGWLGVESNTSPMTMRRRSQWWRGRCHISLRIAAQSDPYSRYSIRSPLGAMDSKRKDLATREYKLLVANSEGKIIARILTKKYLSIFLLNN